MKRTFTWWLFFFFFFPWQLSLPHLWNTMEPSGFVWLQTSIAESVPLWRPRGLSHTRSATLHLKGSSERTVLKEKKKIRNENYIIDLFDSTVEPEKRLHLNLDMLVCSQPNAGRLCSTGSNRPESLWEPPEHHWYQYGDVTRKQQLWSQSSCRTPRNFNTTFSSALYFVVTIRNSKTFLIEQSCV